MCALGSLHLVEGLKPPLSVGIVNLGLLDDVCNLFQEGGIISVTWIASLVLVIAKMLDFLALMLDLCQTQRGGRAFEEMA